MSREAADQSMMKRSRVPAPPSKVTWSEVARSTARVSLPPSPEKFVEVLLKAGSVEASPAGLTTVPRTSRTSSPSPASRSIASIEVSLVPLDSVTVPPVCICLRTIVLAPEPERAMTARSKPSPPLISSMPLPPFRVSSPPFPMRMSLNSPPFSVSLPVPPLRLKRST